MDDLVYVLIITLACALLLAMTIPAPARAPANEAGLYLTLLGAGCLGAFLMGVLALLDRSLEGGVCGRSPGCS